MFRALQHLTIVFYLLMSGIGTAWANSPENQITPFLSAPQIQSLGAGQVLTSVEKVVGPSGKSARISSAIQINASPEAIWTVLIDCDRAPSYVPGLKKCEILEAAKDKSWDIRRHTNKPAAFLPKIKSEFRCEYDYAKSVRFTSTRGSDMNTNTGSWTLTPAEAW